MGLFDFPRVHFSGDIDINVPTINNAYYFPLTIYDATRSEAFLPPRLYFSTKEKITSVQSPLNAAAVFDQLNGYYYIEIKPINTIPLLRTWCETKIGSDNNAPDAAYLPYYAAADNDLVPVEGGATLVGFCPGYWNMYGDMSVKMSNTKVTGVQTFDGAGITNWTKNSKNIPAAINSLLNASCNLDTYPDSGITTASMVETISSQSVYANIFCSNVNLFNANNANEVFLQGTPARFSALIYAAWRVINWVPPMAGSGRFCSSIPIEDISDPDRSLLFKFFVSNKAYDKRILKGVFVTFTTFEVYENRYDQDYYQKNGTKPNPAQCTTVGSITPWYEGDMRAGVLGRNLISLGMNPIYNNTNASPGNSIPVNLIPPIASLKTLDNGNAIFSVDMGNSWPELINPPFSTQPPVFMPAHRGDASFETPNLGDLIFRYNANTSSEIARIKINPTDNPRKNVFTTGCVFDFLLTDKTLIRNVQDNLILGFLSANNKETQVAQESEYMISSDQKGLYTEQGYSPSMGYQVYDENRVPCRVRIFQKGVPVTNPVQVAVAEYIVPEAANDPLKGPDNVKWQSLADNSVVALSDADLQLSNNAVYYFVYNGQYPNNAIPPFNTGNYTVMDTGSFVCLRVHPTKDYSKYMNPSHPGYTPPTFAVVYEEVFKMYDVAYPIMALIHPFTADVWENGTIAGLVLQRTDPKLWNNILYMPKSRELSASQLALLKAWVQYVNNKSK